VVTANGLLGSVANPTATPAITLSTNINGIVKGNGTSLLSATSGTHYSAGMSALATGIVKSTTVTWDLTIAVAGASQRLINLLQVVFLVRMLYYSIDFLFY